MIPLNESERFEFLVKFIVSKNFGFDVDKFWRNYKNGTFEFQKAEFLIILEKCQEVIKSIETSKSEDRLMTNPLLLRMIAEMLNYESFVASNLTIYEVFEIFIDKKLEVVRQKGEIVGKSIDKMLKTSANIMEIHQIYALKQIFPNVNTSYLEIMKKISKLSTEEISRFGILEVKSEDDFSFVHQTFAEFFVSQFLIETIDKINLKDSENDARLNVYLLGFVLTAEELTVVKSFVISFIKTRPKVPKLFEYLKEKGVSLDFSMDDYFATHNTYANIFKFFKTNHNIDLNVDYEKFQIYLN